MATETTIDLQALDGPSSITSKEPTAVTTQAIGHTLGHNPPSPALLPPAGDAEAISANPKLPPSRAWLVILQLSSINFLSSFTNGLLAIGLPTIAADLALQPNLLLWPNSVFWLTSGSCLLVAGSIADVLGPKKAFLPGCLLVGVFMLLCGVARDGLEFILFRAMQGAATAAVLPSAVAVVSNNVEDGRPRNVGFASIFLGMILGFACGLVLGGVLVNSIGWRFGYYISGAMGVGIFAVGCWSLPADERSGGWKSTVRRLRTEVDWVGAAIASACFAMLSYVLALLSADTKNIKAAATIALLVVSLVLVPAFIAWMHFQEKRGKPALIPNSMWKKGAFTGVCLMIMLSCSVNSCLEIFCSLFFQQVQLNTSLHAGLKILPQVLVGALLSVLVGQFVNRAPILPTVLIGNILQAGSPLLMATVNPHWPYWYSAFFAQLLAPCSIDILFTIGTIVVSNAFPAKTQALACAVLQTFAQLGTSVGLCLMSIISESVTRKTGFEDKDGPEVLMEGYRAAFWAMSALMGVACVIGVVGLRKVGKVGVKRD